MILNGTGDNLQAFMSAAAATTNPAFFVTYADINTTTSALTPDSAGGALNGTTDVNLVSGVAGAKRMIKNLSICNIDTAPVVVTVQFEDGTDRPIVKSITIPKDITLYWSLETGWVLQPAENQGFRGALVTRTTAQTITTGTTTAMEFDVSTYDVGGFHDTVTNNSRFTIPAGVSKVLLIAGGRIESNSTGHRAWFMEKNGTSFFVSESIDALAATTTDMSCAAMQDCVEGDFFEINVFQGSGGDLDMLTTIPPFFSIYVIDS